MLNNPWIPHPPHQRQAEFLCYDTVREVMFGGAAGGSKSDSLLMAALMYVDTPGYAAIIFRRTYADLALPGALMARAAAWLSGTAAHWSGQDKQWRFPSGATLSFGYLENEADKFRYKSSEFQFIGFDELTQFLETQYLFLFSRLRRLAGSPIPVRMRSGTNPGDVGHDWVKRRFIPDEAMKASPEEFFAHSWRKGDRVFVPARIEDNPSLDLPEYERALAQLDPVTRAQYRHGDWKAHAGGRFRPEWWRRYRLQVDTLFLDDGSFRVLHDIPRIIIVDPAGRKTKNSKYTAMGVFGDMGKQRLVVLDMVRRQLAIEEIVPELRRLAWRWSPTWVGIEANGFQQALVNEARLWPDMPTVVEMEPEGKSKMTRNTPAIIRAEQGLIYLPHEAAWLDDFEGELQQFTGDEKLDAYTDQTDTLGYAVLGADRYSMFPAGEPALAAINHQREIWKDAGYGPAIPPPSSDASVGGGMRQVPRRGRIGW